MAASIALCMLSGAINVILTSPMSATMMEDMGLFTKMFGTRSEREVKKLSATVDKVMALEEPYKKLSDEELKAKTGISEATGNPLT